MPINEQLYQALRRLFRRVEITNPGERPQVFHAPDYSRRGRMQVSVTGGEFYKVCCPFCGDTRMRLFFSCLWGTEDQRTRRELLHVVHCFNEDCVHNRARQLELRDRIFPFKDCVRLPPSKPRASQTTPAKAVTAQGTWDLDVPLLPEGYREGANRISSPEAREYLAQRNFDAGELERRWGVWYCERSSIPRPRIRNRLVIPVYRLESDWESPSGGNRIELAGWQARLIGEPTDDEPKYMTMAGMRKSTLLYGLPQAVETSGPIVVCEGVTDVWRLRTNAVAIFGNTISDEQRRSLVAEFRNRPLVVLFDRESTAAAEQKTLLKALHTVESLKFLRDSNSDDFPVVLATPPPGRKDVGECTFEEAWTCVAKPIGQRPSRLIAEISETLSHTTRCADDSR